MTPAERNIRAIERMIRNAHGAPWTPADAPRLYAEALEQYDRRVPAYAPFPHIMPNDRDASAKEIARRRVRGQLWDDRDHGIHDSPFSEVEAGGEDADLGGLAVEDRGTSLWSDDDEGGSLADQRGYVDDETRWRIYLGDRAEFGNVYGALTPSGRAEYLRRLPAAWDAEFGSIAGYTWGRHAEERCIRMELALARSLLETATEIDRSARLFEWRADLEAELSPDELAMLDRRGPDGPKLAALAAIEGVSVKTISLRERKVADKADSIWHRRFGPIPSPLGRRQRHGG
jgi:hypothetical protein